MADPQTATREIQASPQELFEIITDLEAYPDWVDGMEGVEIHDETSEGYPAKATMQVDAQIKRVTYTLVYDYDYPTEIRWTSEPGGDMKQVEGAYRFIPQDDNTTLVEYELILDPGFPVPGFLLRKAQKSIMESALRGLESQAADQA